MSNTICSRTCTIAAAVLLTGSLALAQATTATSTDKKNAATPVAPVATAREASSGMATGRRQASGEAAVAPQPGDTAEAKKHIANIKWEDRQASNQQTLDGASKDAAKSPVKPLDATSKDAAKSKAAPTATPDTKRENKVESITVKQ
ncbi:MAG TPA: hypothetical protein VF865_22030 [Acidobacteriaceae bacterium]